MLPLQREQEDESPDEFASRVQKQIAEELRVVPTSFTSADKTELIKASQRGSESVPVYQTGITHMAQQVQEVLPHVPIQNILADLGRC